MIPFLVLEDKPCGICGKLQLYSSSVLDGKEKVISYDSRSFKNPERNYSTSELEALAFVSLLLKALKSTCIRSIFNILAHTVNFEVITDHCAIVFQETFRLTPSSMGP